MKVVAVDFLDEGDGFDQLVVIYFTAPHRVDFRSLVGDLARSLQSRIDLRQIGSRDGARLTGGLGSCGRDLCCATFLSDFEPVSLRMARTQDLPANPLRISGACGRLMCCLKYEHPLYAEFARTAPAVGAAVTTDAGDGVVVAHQVPADALLVRMKDSGQISSCSRSSVCGSRQAYETRPDSRPGRLQAAAPPRPTGRRRAVVSRRIRAVSALILAVGLSACSVTGSNGTVDADRARPGSLLPGHHLRRPGDSHAGPAPTGRPLLPVPARDFLKPPAGPDGLARYRQQQVVWNRCAAGVQCADLRAPLDYARPNDAAITLALGPAAAHRGGSGCALRQSRRAGRLRCGHGEVVQGAGSLPLRHRLLGRPRVRPLDGRGLLRES